jgi:tetratricopeptide (TPR) repeat protein
MPERKIDISRVIAQSDHLFKSGRSSAVGEHLRTALAQARELGDRSAELTILSELMGHYRMSGDRERGLAAVSDGVKLLDELQVRSTVSGGTILINGATALQSFGEVEKALVLYNEAYGCYEKLADNDPLLAALFNNMASAYAACGDTATAGAYYLAAAGILEENHNLMDRAVALVNLARVDDDCEKYLDEAMKCFDAPEAVRDGYYAHTARKCAGAFGEFGQIDRRKELEKRAEVIYERH